MVGYISSVKIGHFEIIKIAMYYFDYIFDLVLFLFFFFALKFSFALNFV